MAKNRQTIYEELKGGAREVMSQIRSLIRTGNARTIIIKNRHGRTLFRTQLTLALAGPAGLVAAAPMLSAIAAILLMVNQTTVIVERVVSAEEERKRETSTGVTDDADVTDIPDPSGL